MEFIPELFGRLEDDEKPFPKRMRLAQNAYYATGGSSERIVVWICTRLKSISQENFSEFCTEWRKLVSSVHNQHIRPLVKLMLEVVNEHLTKEFVKDDVFNYAVSVLENTRVQNYFSTDLDNYIAFVRSLLFTLASRPNKDENTCGKLLETMEVFGRMITLREFPVLFLDQLLLPSVHLVNSVQPHSHLLPKHLLSCVEMCVFFRNTPLLAAYLDTLCIRKKKKAEQSKEPPQKNDLSQLQAHFKTGYKLLEKLCLAPSDGGESDVLLTYTTVFNCLVKANHASLLTFKMLMVLCPLIGINVDNAKLKVKLPDELKQHSKAAPDELSFNILESILTVILKGNLPIPDDGELKCVNWIECLWRSILSVPMGIRQSGAYLRCLTTLLQLHPRVVMNRHLQIITDVLVALTPEKELPEFVPFLHTLMSIHQKRFSVQELLTNMFTSSKQLLNTRKRLNTTTLSVDKIVPLSIYQDIQKHAADWTSAPVHDFMDFMITQLQTLAFTSDNQRNAHTDTSTAVAVRLLCGVLSGARIADHCGNEKIRLAYVSRLNNLSQVLKQMAAVTKTTDNLVFIQSFLNLEDTWAAVAIMLHHYCPEASEALKDFGKPQVNIEGVTEEQYSATIQAFSFVHSHISPGDWDLIHSKIAGLREIGTQQLLVRLQVQLLRYFIISNSESRERTSSIAKELLPQLVSYMDLENMLNDIFCVAKFLENDELKQLIDKLVEILVSSADGDRKQFYAKNFSRLQENKAVVCGMALNLLERLGSVASSERNWLTSQKILHKLVSSGVNTDCVNEEWDGVLTSLGKALSKALKKSLGLEVRLLAELSSVKQIISVLNLLPLEFLPENLQTALFFVMFGLSADLSSSEKAEDKASLVDLIYHELIFGMLERWPITTEAPPLQRYVNIAQMISHVKNATNLLSDKDVKIVHALLGISLRCETSANKVVEAFFPDNGISPEDYVIHQEMLNVVCKDSLRSECRELLKSSNYENRVVSCLLTVIQQERPKKHLLPTYTLLLSRNLKKKENLEGLLSVLGDYCKIALKVLRKEKQKRQSGEEFLLEALKYFELQGSLPENFLRDVWTALLEIDEPKTDIASLLFSGANKCDFEFMVQRITKELESLNSATSRVNVLMMWEALIKSAVISEHNLEVRLDAISFFLAQHHVFLKYPVNHLLKVLLSIAETSKIVVRVYTADNILQAVSTVMNRKNRMDNVTLLPTWFAILDSMLFHRTSQTLDCLPAFTAELRHLIQNVVTCSRQNEHLDVCIRIAHGIEKMFQTIVKAKLTRNFIRIGAYFLADLLKHFEGQLPQDIKVILENIACEILGFLDIFAQRFLAKVVTAESGEILREIGRIRNMRRTKMV